jgi:hypothetical protein
MPNNLKFFLRNFCRGEAEASDVCHLTKETKNPSFWGSPAARNIGETGNRGLLRNHGVASAGIRIGGAPAEDRW